MEDGLQFQHFEVLTRPDGSPHVLGKGAMGTTYKAFDRNLHSLVVIKVINPQYVTNNVAKQRFLQEAQAMAKIKHPNVADVFHLGESPNGVFYAMEFCDGMTVQEFVQRHDALRLTDALLVARQVASALQAIASAELIHRDIKPSNLILTNDVQGNTQTKVIDFGLARAGGESADLTQGGFVGTPTFASPEQLLEQESLDIRSDIYSLGVTLWYMLVGKAPFGGSQFEVMFHHVNSPPPWDQLPPMAPGARAVLDRTLQKAADNRYPTPEALWKELAACLEDEGLADPDSTPKIQFGKKAEEENGSIIGKSNYEILSEVGRGRHGKTFQAKDAVTNQIVALKFLDQDIVEKTDLLKSIQTEARRLRELYHANLVSIVDFQSGEDGTKLVSEWVDGVSLLDLFKARGHLPVSQAAPLLAQLSSALDYSILHQVDNVETEIHKVLISFGTRKDAAEASQFLRSDIGQWEEFGLKLNPLGLSWSAGNYPSSSGPSRGVSRSGGARLFHDFLQITYRMLGGVGGSQTSRQNYTTIPHLSADGNEVLERYLIDCDTAGAPDAERPSCREILTELFEAEECGYELPPEPDETVADETFAGEPADGDQTLDSSMLTARSPTSSGFRPSGPATGSNIPPGPAPGSSMARAGSSFGSSPLMQGSSQGSSASQYAVRRQELELQRRALEAEAEHLNNQEMLEAERRMLSEERELLEQQRDELLKLERERSEVAQEERKKLESERHKLESVNAELAEKKTEQERLQQEIKLQAQLEFQKLQEEREHQEHTWRERQEATERTLREKEEQFLLREQQSLKKLREERETLSQKQKHFEKEQASTQLKKTTETQQLADEIAAERRGLLQRQRELEEQLSARDTELLEARRELQQAAEQFNANRQKLEEEKTALKAQQEEALAKHTTELESARAQLQRDQETLEEERAELQASYEQRLSEARTKLEEAEAAFSQKSGSLEKTIRSLSEEREKEKIDHSRIAELEKELTTERDSIASERSRFENERHTLGQTLQSEIDTRQKTLDSRAGKLEADAAEFLRQKDKSETGLREREASLEREWQALENAKADARREAGTQLDEERKTLSLEREELAEQAARLAAKAEQAATERETSARKAAEEIERQRGELALREREIEKEQQRLRASFEEEKTAVLKQDQDKRRNEEETHRKHMEERSRQLSELESAQNEKLQALEKEIAEQEERLTEKREEVFTQERIHEAVFRQAEDFDDTLKEKLEEEQQSLDQQRSEIEEQLTALKKAQKRRLITIVCGVIATGISAYFVKGQLIDSRDLEGSDAWEKTQIQRQRVREAGDWPELLRWSVTVDKQLSTDASFAEVYAKKRPEIIADAQLAIENLLTLPPENIPADTDLTMLLQNLDLVSRGWDLPPTTLLLRAKLSIPEDITRRDYRAALSTYLDATGTDPNFIQALGGELQSIAGVAITDFREDSAIDQQPEVRELLKKISGAALTEAPRLDLLAAEIDAEHARARNDYAGAFDAVLHAIQKDANWKPELLPLVRRLAAGAAARPAPEIRGLQNRLVDIADTWRLSGPYVTLAESTPEQQIQERFDFYRKADELGDISARAHVGRFYLGYGVANNSRSDIEKGLKLLKESAGAGNLTGQFLLGEVYFAGVGTEENLSEAARLAQTSLDAGHPRANLLLGQVQLRQAEKSRDSAEFSKASTTLEKATREVGAEAYYYLYVSYWNEVVRDAENSAKTLQAGAEKGDSNCQYLLGIWYAAGNQPLEQNLTRAREYMLTAASQNHPGAREWCHKEALRIRRSGNDAEREWVTENRDLWE